MADLQFGRVSSKGQFTLPKRFRSALGIRTGTNVACEMHKGELRIRVAEPRDRNDDPVLDEFLKLIDKDIAKNAALFHMPKYLEARMREAAKQDVDLEDEIEGDIEF
ncbi:putative regulator PrlF [Roseovarius mucosus]|uniref:Putative regulator PrlF n=1 Tax=Roseovarius mucosus TaxID=215743 RepID=A0A1V0RRW7_9RHOB|nr:type II toxin-antitoxin system PrlF family antitoxin [Roseovarius mucosus]ARE84385.1 putative regulator PrlF [Roseovarius mucosus]